MLMLINYSDTSVKNHFGSPRNKKIKQYELRSCIPGLDSKVSPEITQCTYLICVTNKLLPQVLITSGGASTHRQTL